MVAHRRLLKSLNCKSIAQPEICLPSFTLTLPDPAGTFAAMGMGSPENRPQEADYSYRNALVLRLV